MLLHMHARSAVLKDLFPHDTLLSFLSRPRKTISGLLDPANLPHLSNGQSHGDRTEAGATTLSPVSSFAHAQTSFLLANR